MFLVRPQCAAVCAFPVSVHAEMSARLEGATAARWGKPDADHAPSRSGVMGSPVFQGQSKTTLARSAPWIFCADCQHGKVWPFGRQPRCYHVPAPVQTQNDIPFFTFLLWKQWREKASRPQMNRPGQRMLRNSAEKRASPGRPQGNFRLDCLSQVRLTAACLRNPPPYFKSAPLQVAPAVEQLASHIAALDYIADTVGRRWPSTTFYNCLRFRL